MNENDQFAESTDVQPDRDLSEELNSLITQQVNAVENMQRPYTIEQWRIIDNALYNSDRLQVIQAAAIQDENFLNFLMDHWRDIVGVQETEISKLAELIINLMEIKPQTIDFFKRNWTQAVEYVVKTTNSGVAYKTQIKEIIEKIKELDPNATEWTHEMVTEITHDKPLRSLESLLEFIYLSSPEEETWIFDNLQTIIDQCYKYEGNFIKSPTEFVNFLFQQKGAEWMVSHFEEMKIFGLPFLVEAFLDNEQFAVLKGQWPEIFEVVPDKILHKYTDTFIENGEEQWVMDNWDQLAERLQDSWQERFIFKLIKKGHGDWVIQNWGKLNKRLQVERVVNALSESGYSRVMSRLQLLTRSVFN